MLQRRACHLFSFLGHKRVGIISLSQMFQSYKTDREAMGNSSSSAEAKDRAVAAVIGGLVADAGATTTHWNYDVADIDKALAEEGVTNPEFLPKTHCPYYLIAPGNNSCYGDQTYSLLKSLVESKGFDKENYKKTLFETFGPDSAYHYNGYKSVPKEELPAQGPWRNHCILHYLECFNEGKEQTGHDDSMGDCYAKIPPIVALYAGKPEMKEKVEQIVRVTQDNDLAVKVGIAAAYILEEIILNGPCPEVIDRVKDKFDPAVAEKIAEAMSRKDEDHRACVKDFGLSCALPGSIQGAIHCLAKSNGVYADAVRMTMIAGGDNCPRVAFVGACTAAGAGLSNLPKDWVEKAVKGKEITELAEKLVALRFK